MTITETRPPLDTAQRGKQWAQYCGIEYCATGTINGVKWAYTDDTGICTVCELDVTAGRLAWVNGATVAHIACQAPTRAQEGLGFGECGKLDRALRGGSHPNPKAAAKQLDKLDPRTCPRFTITAPDAYTNATGLRELAVAGMMFQGRRDQVLAGGVPALAPIRKAKPAPKVAASRPEPAPVPASRVMIETVVNAAIAAGAEVITEQPAPIADTRELETCLPCLRAGRVIDKYVGAECPSCGTAAPVKRADVTGELPQCVAAWLERLVYGPKAEYARAWAEHTFCGAPAPDDPGAEWASKARKRMGYVLAG